MYSHLKYILYTRSASNVTPSYRYSHTSIYTYSEIWLCYWNLVYKLLKNNEVNSTVKLCQIILYVYHLIEAILYDNIFIEQITLYPFQHD